MKIFLVKINAPLIARLLLGAIFIYASIDKIMNPVEFSNSIDNYHISPLSLNNLAALILPWVELIIGVCLITGIFMDGAIILTMGLLVFFIFIITQAYARGISLNCGCFKTAADPGFGDLKADMLKRIFEDILFLGLAFIVYFKDYFKKANS